MSLQVEYGFGLKQERRPKVVQWIKPPLGCLKLNTDACFRGSSAVGGGILRNNDGNVVFAFHEYYGESCSNILEAELRALLTGLKFCFESGYIFKFNIWAEIDSKVGIQCMEGHTDRSLSVDFLHVLDEIRTWCHRFRVSLTHIYREGNGAADQMASQGFYTRYYKVLRPRDLHKLVLAIVIRERSNHSYVRQ